MVGTQAVGVGVSVFVGVVSVPVGVFVGVCVTGVLVGVCVTGVLVKVAVEVGVYDGVNVAVGATARLRKTAMVCVEAFPCTMVTVTLLVFRSSLSRRSAGIVYTSVTAYPACASSWIVKVPASTPMSPEHAPAGMVTDLPANLKVK